MTNAQKSTVERIIAEVNALPYETLVAIDGDGQVLEYMTGTQEQVALSPSFQLLMQLGLLDDVYVVHNHPEQDGLVSGGKFCHSDADMYVFFQSGLKGFITVAYGKEWWLERTEKTPNRKSYWGYGVDRLRNDFFMLGSQETSNPYMLNEDPDLRERVMRRLAELNGATFTVKGE